MRKTRYILFIALSLILGSCSYDKGNYEYADLKEPAISGIADQSVLTFSRLRITPDLGDDEFPEGEYSFEWKVINNNGTEEPVVIGSGRWPERISWVFGVWKKWKLPQPKDALSRPHV